MKDKINKLEDELKTAKDNLENNKEECPDYNQGEFDWDEGYIAGLEHAIDVLKGKEND